jgi:anti-sigma B factor antagonist
MSAADRVDESRLDDLVDIGSGLPIRVVSKPLGDGIVVAVTGEIDLATVACVEDELLQAAQSHDLVVLDLREVSFMDSTGLHLAIVADRRIRERGGRLVIVQDSPRLSRLFELTGAGDRLEIVAGMAELDAPGPRQRG